LAISSDGTKGSDDSFNQDQICFEVSLLKIVRVGVSEICTRTPPITRKATAADLLGPLALYQRDAHSDFDWGVLPKHLPCSQYLASETLTLDPRRVLERCVTYTKDEINRMLVAMGVEAESKPRNLEEKDRSIATGEKVLPQQSQGGAWTSVEPFHVDLSRLRAFYSETNLTPPFHRDSRKAKQGEISPWRVQMGDTVLVHCDGAKRSPLNCNWGGKIIFVV
jgi:hypothetical protein